MWNVITGPVTFDRSTGRMAALPPLALVHSRRLGRLARLTGLKEHHPGRTCRLRAVARHRAQTKIVTGNWLWRPTRCQPAPLIEIVALIMGGGTSGTYFGVEKTPMVMGKPWAQIFCAYIFISTAYIFISMALSPWARCDCTSSDRAPLLLRGEHPRRHRG